MTSELQNIVTQASQLFMQYGIKSVTMEDIASKIGISKKTIYQVIKDKNDLVHHFLQYETNRFAGELNACIESYENAVDQLLQIFKTMLNRLKYYNASTDLDLSRHFPEMYNKTNQVVQHSIEQVLLDNYKKGINEQHYKNALNAYVIAKMYLFIFYGIPHHTEVISLQEFTSDSFQQGIISYHFESICTEKGMVQFKNSFTNFFN
jgi:AcrR family transcriptional regulator